LLVFINSYLRENGRKTGVANERPTNTLSLLEFEPMMSMLSVVSVSVSHQRISLVVGIFSFFIKKYYYFIIERESRSAVHVVFSSQFLILFLQNFFTTGGRTTTHQHRHIIETINQTP
jgi:hypothetical protein